MTTMDGTQQQEQKGRKRKCNRKKPCRQKDVGGGILLVHDKAFTRCLSTGCYHCENKEGLQCGDRDDESGNAQLCSSCSNDDQHQMSETSPCCHGVPPASHPDGCELVMESAVKEVYAIDDVGSDKTTVHDNALAGCLADGCHHHGTGYLPCICEGGVPTSNAQLC